MLRLVGRALPEFQHLPTLLGYDHANGLVVADARGDNGSLACLLAHRSTRSQLELDRAELLHAVRRSPIAAVAAVRPPWPNTSCWPGAKCQTTSLIAGDLVLLPCALVPVPMAPPRSVPTLSLGSALADGVTIEGAGGAADVAGTCVLRARQLRVLGGYV